jgi:hypothetical protein
MRDFFFAWLKNKFPWMFAKFLESDPYAFLGLTSSAQQVEVKKSALRTNVPKALHNLLANL